EAVAAEQLQAVYRRRAIRLAERQRRAVSGSPQIAILVFLLGEERYGLELSGVVQVFPALACTPVPGGPLPLLGISNFHGEVRSVIDFRRLVHLAANEVDSPDTRSGSNHASGYLLLLRSANGEFALRVEQVESIHHLDVSDWKAAMGQQS